MFKIIHSDTVSIRIGIVLNWAQCLHLPDVLYSSEANKYYHH